MLGQFLMSTAGRTRSPANFPRSRWPIEVDSLAKFSGSARIGARPPDERKAHCFRRTKWLEASEPQAQPAGPCVQYSSLRVSGKQTALDKRVSPRPLESSRGPIVGRRFASATSGTFVIV